MTTATPTRPQPTTETPAEDDGVRWLALLLRRGVLVINGGIEQRYGIQRETSN